VDTEPLLVLGIVDALLVALFFLFGVLPWSRPGPWRLIWLIAGMASMLFIASELVALGTQGAALWLPEAQRFTTTEAVRGSRTTAAAVSRVSPTRVKDERP
jgi:hypothetical protein